jgi:HSP20 family molecular chaperone IbpA
MRKDDIEIQFNDTQTMLIRRRIKRSYTPSTPPAGQVEGSSSGRAITEKGEEHDRKAPTATVEDEDSEAASTVIAVDAAKYEQRSKDTAKYWVSERSIGEFSRSFNFPVHIDQGAVKASLRMES